MEGGLSGQVIGLASAIVVALIGGFFGVPFLQRKQNKRASEISTLSQTDELMFKRVQFMMTQFDELEIEHAELKTEVEAERIIRGQFVRYMRRLFRWAKSRDTDAANPMPEPPAELEMYLED